MLTIVCSQCGAAFTAKRSTRKTCSDACKSRASRQSRDPGTGDPERRKRPHAPRSAPVVTRREGATTYYAPASPEEVAIIRRRARAVPPEMRKDVIRGLQESRLLPNREGEAPPRWREPSYPAIVSEVPLSQSSRAEISLSGLSHRLYRRTPQFPTPFEDLLDGGNDRSALEKPGVTLADAQLAAALLASTPRGHEHPTDVGAPHVRKALARYKMAAHVMNLARLCGVEDENITVIKGAKRFLASDPVTRFLLWLIVDEIRAKEREIRVKEREHSETLRRWRRSVTHTEQLERLIEVRSQARARRYEEELRVAGEPAGSGVPCLP